MNTSELVRMANQIATHLASYPRDEAVSELADHINSFWEPRMRRAFLDHTTANRDGLHDLVLAAIPSIRKPAPKAI